MLRIYRQIFDLLDVGERRRFVVLMGLMVVVAFAEVLGMSSVLMLLGVLARPAQISDSPQLSLAYEWLGFTDPVTFQIFLAGGVFVVVMGGTVIKAFGNYAILSFSNSCSSTLSTRLLISYLRQPYAWFLGRNSADISRSVLEEVHQLTYDVIVPSLRLVSNSLLALVVVGFLLAVDPLVSLMAAGLMAGGYSAIYLAFRSRLLRLSHEMRASNRSRFRLAQEATAGFREVKLMGLEDVYTERFGAAARSFARTLTQRLAIGETPRFLLEALTFGTLLMVVFVLLLRNEGDLLAVIPTLGIFAFAVMRLLPSAQQIYYGLTSIRSGTAVFEALHSDFMTTMPLPPNVLPAEEKMEHVPRLPLTRVLELDGLGYAYPEAGRAALDEVSLAIPARQTVGIVGGTGAGKTTLVDLILGLLVPQTGTIRVDGVAVTRETLRAWQRTLGYVPQAIYLTDDTVAANIAFGVPPEEIDRAAVERAARLAALHGFIASELPQSYDTFVGERGVRLSGGQRQRIGIARALYHDPTLLILDEATSALDNITERVVMEAVASIRADKTIILIAHRLSTVKDCDMIFLMEKGRLVAQGTYDELVAGNETFRKMAVGT